MGTWPFTSSCTSGPASPPSGAARSQHYDSHPTPPPEDGHPAKQPAENRPTDAIDEAFFALRRFADEQVRILVDGLATVPTILSDLKARGTDSRWSAENFASRADQPLAFTSQHFEPPFQPTGPAQSSSEAIAAARTLLIQSRNANAAAGVTPDAILRLYRESTAQLLPPSYRRFHAHTQLARHPFVDQEPWLSVAWFGSNSYSPTQLETHEHAHQHGSMWRAAFEDLLSASLGKEGEAGKGRDAWTGRTDDQARFAAWAAAPRDWMLGLQCRGILPPQLPALYEHVHPRDIDHIFKGLVSAEQGSIPPVADFWHLVGAVAHWDDRDEKEEAVRGEEKSQTELDAYEQFLGRTSGKTAPTEAKDQQMTAPTRAFTEKADTQMPASSVIKSKILSTLSTTERTTLPDGTITTKVVLRKRFADGREESTETISTTHASDEKKSQVEVRGYATEQSQPDHRRGDERRQSKGWFWF